MVKKIIFSCLMVSLCFKMLSFTIVIDPGHGGKFLGCQNDNLKEKDLVLDIVKRLACLLKKHNNLKVVLTRKGDYSLSNNLVDDLALRAKVADVHGANLFVSIHINSKADKRVRGFELYVPYKKKFPIKSYLCASVLHHCLSQEVDTNFVGNLGNVNAFDRGVRAARFTVLDKVSCPAVLVEWDYLTNSQVKKQLLSEDYRQRCAVVLEKGLIKYIAGQKYA